MLAFLKIFPKAAVMKDLNNLSVHVANFQGEAVASLEPN